MKEVDVRVARCIRLGQWLGGLAGGVWILVLTVAALLGFGPREGGDPAWQAWQTLAICVPAGLAGTIAGVLMGRWVGSKLADPSRKTAFSMVVGAGVGAVAGAVILGVELLLFYGIGSATGGIHFRDDVNLVEIAIGCAAYGALCGAMIGVLPGILLGILISVYLKSPK